MPEEKRNAQKKSEASMKVSIAKVKLQEGEELMDFVNKVMEAVAQNRQKTQRSLFLRGIFKGFIIMRDFESGKFMQAKLTRDKEGLVKLGDPFEVRQTFVPIASAVDKSEEQAETLFAIGGDVMHSRLPKEQLVALVKSADDAEEFDFVEVEKEGERVSWTGIV